MDQRLQRAGDFLQAGVTVGLSLPFEKRGKVVYLDHDDRHVPPFARRTPPFVFEHLLEVLLGVQAGHDIEGGPSQQFVLEKGHPLVPLVDLDLQPRDLSATRRTPTR